jgi:hypothetical protein
MSAASSSAKNTTRPDDHADAIALLLITYDDLIEAIIPRNWRWRGRAQRPAQRPATDKAPVR